jgi:hypothetical protein
MIQIHIIPIRIKHIGTLPNIKWYPKHKRIQKQILQFLSRIQNFIRLAQYTNTCAIICNFISFIDVLKLTIFYVVYVFTYSFFIVRIYIATHH